MSSFVVVYDACVLYPAPLRDLLIRIAGTGIVRARWTAQITDEMVRSILANRPDLDAAQLGRTVELMSRAVPDALVSQHEHLIEAIDIPDPDDRHVVAAAIRCGAQAIVTYNLQDFPDHDLARWDLEAKHPDEFVAESFDLAPAVVMRCVVEQAAALHNPRLSVDDVLDILEQARLNRSVAAMRGAGGGPMA